MTDQEILARLTDKHALTCTMMGEAVGDAREGSSSVEERIAVGCVIRNRVREPKKYGDGYKGVCLRRYQFSCWNANDPNRERLIRMAFLLVTGQPSMDPFVDECAFLAEGLTSGILLDRVRGSNHYVTTALLKSAPPAWASGRTPVLVVGSHTFFKL